ncbi:MAG: Spy/CpxP family protein refolding chaperone [Variibacter sp.]
MTHIDSENAAPAPQPQQGAATPNSQRGCRGRGGGVRRVIFASVLLLVGGLIGAVITKSSYGFAPGPGWHHGPHAWMQGGPGGPPAFASRIFFPGRIERGVDNVMSIVDGSSEQRKKVSAIVEKAADDLYALRAQHLEGRKQLREALAAPTIDHARVETLRTEQLKLADTASKRLTDALVAAAEVLTPAQRAELAQRVERYERWFRG